MFFQTIFLLIPKVLILFFVVKQNELLTYDSTLIMFYFKKKNVNLRFINFSSLYPHGKKKFTCTLQIEIKVSLIF